MKVLREMMAVSGAGARRNVESIVASVGAMAVVEVWTGTKGGYKESKEGMKAKSKSTRYRNTTCRADQGLLRLKLSLIR